MPSRSAIAATSFAVWFASHGWSTVEPWTARIIAMSSSAICEGPSSPMDTPACEPHRHIVARLIAAMRTKSYARREEGGERRGERPPAARLEADSGGDHLLLGDVHLEVALGVRLREHLGERRVGYLAVDGDDVSAGRADRGERVAVGLARRHLLAELVPRELERPGLEAVRLAGLGEPRLEAQVAHAAQLGDGRLGIVERLAVPAVLVLDGRHALALQRRGEDRRRPARQRRGVRVGLVDLPRRRGRRSRSRASRTPARARRARRCPGRPSSRRAGPAG